MTEEDAKFLREINNRLKEEGKILNVGVTIIRYKEYQNIELNAPNVESRIDGLKRLYNNNNIGCNVIIRPLFPDAEISDLENIIDKTISYSYGYLIGPLYLNSNTEKYFLNKKIDLDVKCKQPEWNGGRSIDVVYSPKIEKELEKIIEKRGSRVYKNNQECVNAIKSIILEESL